jgi:hypothetical protein
VVIGQQPSRPHEADLGLKKLSLQDIKMLPKGVEADLFRVLQLLPGVSTTSDVSSRYYVRGGGSDQNLVLLNGATIYSPFHTLGIFSVIDPEIVSAMEFHKGGFPPEYGGRMSSVLNVVTRDGNRNRLSGTAQAGMLSGKLSIEGPVPDGSFFVSGRKSWYAAVLKKYLSGREAPFDFYDAFAKVTFQNAGIDENSRFVLFTFLSEDDVRHDDPFRSDYGIRNKVVGLNWYRVWASPLYSTLTVAHSGLDAFMNPKFSSALPRRNTVRDLTVNLDFTYIYDSRDEVAFGLHSKFVRIGLDQTNAYGQSILFRQYGRDVNLYADYKFYRWESLGATIGVRLKFSALSHYRPILYEPRISVTYRPNPVLALKGAFGWYSQEVVTLVDENELISVLEPWIITPGNVNSSLAVHAAVGLKAYVTDRFTVELEAYYKPISDLIDANAKKFTERDPDFVNVDGDAYGVEAVIDIQPPGYVFKSSYSLSWAHKIIGAVRSYPRYDTRHAVSLLAGADLGSGWNVQATWMLRTGMPFTPIAGYYDRLNFGSVWYWDDPDVYEPVIFWGKRNSRRLPFYHRLDLGISKDFRVYSSDWTVEAALVNAYDRKNIFYLDRDTGKRTYMLPFLPTLSLKVRL